MKNRGNHEQQNGEQIPNRVKIQVDYKKGLSDSQVSERVANGQTNQTIDLYSTSNGKIIKDNIFNFFNFLFVILALLLVYVQSYKNLSFFPLVIINTLIGIFQELRSKKVLDNLNVLSSSKVAVVRNGQTVKIDAEELVVDDVVFFQSGEQIMADAIVLHGGVQVNESLLTGESDEIAKEPDSHLLSGSFIVSGNCFAQLDKVGADSYISKLTSQAKKIKENEQSEMVQSINTFIKWIGIIIVPVGMILFSQSFYGNHHTLEHSIVTMVAALIGMIPEGLYLLTTVSLAMGAMRLAKQKVLLHNMKSIETLARVNVLCVDKTGTITENRMVVDEVVLMKDQRMDLLELESLLSDFSKEMTADNDTMRAMKERFLTPSEKKVLSFTTFSSVEKFSSVTFEEGCFVLGAPEMVLRRDYERYSEQIKQFSEKGLRVLVFGKYEGVLEDRKLVCPVTPLGLIVISNPIRENAKQTFQYFAEQGVNIKVISGDNPVTVSYIAHQAGIEGAQAGVDARTLDNLEKLKEALQKFTVFGRVTPEQKEQIVDILKEDGQTVAMTGDGVNDILAMKKADCSIAMASGNDATMKAAQVVLLESDFSKMPQVVLEGRQVVNNIERSASLFLVKNIFSLLMSIFAILFAITYPLSPIQITLISLFTIGTPSFLLALEKNNEKIQGHFMTNVLSKAIPGGVTDMFVVGILIIVGYFFKLSSEDISTVATMLLISVGFFVLYKISTPMNQFRRRVFLFCLFGMGITSLSFSKLFSLSNISMRSLFLLVILFFVAKYMFQTLTLFMERIVPYFQHVDKKKLTNISYLRKSIRIATKKFKQKKKE